MITMALVAGTMALVIGVMSSTKEVKNADWNVMSCERRFVHVQIHDNERYTMSLKKEIDGCDDL